MPIKEKLGLALAERNDFVRVEENINNNLIKIDDDVDATWGGLYGGGKIEDPSVQKVAGKRYIGADGKAYICKVPSNVNNTTNYTPCNVVDNLDKIHNLLNKTILLSNPLNYITFAITALTYNKLLVITGYINITNNGGSIGAGVIGRFSGIVSSTQNYIVIDAVGINGVVKSVGFLQGDEIVLNQDLTSETYGGAVYIRSSGVII